MRSNGIILFISLILASGAASSSSPEHSVGSSPDEWWIGNPAENTHPGAAVNHPQWILDALESKPAVIYVHKICPYCPPQEDAINRTLEQYGDKITYFNIWADGRDSRAADVVVYDPNNGFGDYIPLTAFVTLVRDEDGNLAVGWHSAETLTGEDWIRSYMSDAIYYYEQNSADWNQ